MTDKEQWYIRQSEREYKDNKALAEATNRERYGELTKDAWYIRQSEREYKDNKALAEATNKERYGKS